MEILRYLVSNIFPQPVFRNYWRSGRNSWINIQIAILFKAVSFGIMTKNLVGWFVLNGLVETSLDAQSHGCRCDYPCNKGVPMRLALLFPRIV